MKKHTILFLPLFLVLTSCGQPNIEDDCTVNGNGVVSCTFENAGNKKGASCVTASLEKSRSTSDYEYSFYGNEGDVIKTIDTICSGIVEPMDVKERSKSMTFYGGAFMTASPSDWCRLDNSYSSWFDGCYFTTTPEEKQIEQA